MSATFGGTIKLEGESEYRKALSTINQQIKTTASELSLLAVQYDRGEDSIEKYTSRNKILEKEISQQEEKIALLKGALEQATDTYGETDTKTQKYQQSLNKAQAELIKMQREVEDNNKAIDDFGKETDSATEELKDFSAGAEDGGKKALSLGEIIKANLIADVIKGGLSALANGVKAVGSAMGESLSAGAEYADNILTMSAQTGISTENLQKFNAVAELVDVSTETMTKSMAKNLKSMSSASSGTGAMAEAYKQLGVSVTNADGTLRDSETVYWETIDALKNVTDETQRDSIAMQILGKSAQELNPLIAQGSEGIKAMGDEAVKMGAVLSEDALNSLGAVDDEMQRFSSITGATSNLMASAFAPAVAMLMGGVNDLGGSFNYLISSIISGDEGGIAEASTMLSEGVSAMIENIGTMAPQIIDIIGSLISTTLSVISDNLPTLLEGGLSLLTSLLKGVSNNIALTMPVVMSVITALLQTIVENLPTILNMGIQMLVSLITGIADTLPELIPVAIDSVVLMVETLLDNIDLLIDAGIKLLIALAEGLIEALPRLIDKIPIIIEKLLSAITSNLPKLLQMGITLLVQVGLGLVKAIPQLVSKIPQIISALVSGLKNGAGSLANVGSNLISGLWNGISNKISWLKQRLREFGATVLQSLKDVFGIHSPSTLMRDEVGEYLAEGVGVGFLAGMEKVNSEIRNALPTDYSVGINATANGNIQTSYTVATIEMFKAALSEYSPVVILDEKAVGKFVLSTVSREVFA